MILISFVHLGREVFCVRNVHSQGRRREPSIVFKLAEPHREIFIPETMLMNYNFLFFTALPNPHIVKSVTQLLIYCTLLNRKHCNVVIHRIHTTKKCFKLVGLYAILLFVLRFPSLQDGKIFCYASEFCSSDIVLMASMGRTEKKKTIFSQAINLIPKTWSKALCQTNNSLHGKSLIK